jgi:integrase
VRAWLHNAPPFRPRGAARHHKHVCPRPSLGTPPGDEEAGAPEGYPGRQSGTVPGRLPARPLLRLPRRTPGDDVASLLVRVGGGKLHRLTLAQPLQLKRQAGEAFVARLAQEPQQQEVLVRPPAHRRHQLLSRNVHPKYVQELLGHASIALTLDTYSHVLKGMDGGIGGAMNEALG